MDKWDNKISKKAHAAGNSIKLFSLNESMIGNKKPVAINQPNYLTALLIKRNPILLFVRYAILMNFNLVFIKYVFSYLLQQ